MNNNVKLALKGAFKVVAETALDLGTLATYGWCGQILWNGTVPDIFSLPALTYWQTVSLLTLMYITNTFCSKLDNRQ